MLHLRGKALIYKLNGRELARILYAFAGRRGYIDHGKGTTDDDSGKVKKALSENRKILDENGYETIAQYLLKQPTSRNREGDYRYMVDIEMVTDEVHTIFRHQRDLGSDIATEELEGEYLSALRWLTDTSARDEKIYGRVGYCTYLGAPEKRAASSLISFEMVRAYEKLSNIKIEHQGREASFISPEKRNEIVASLFAVSKNPKPLKWSQLREKLGMQSSDSFDSRLPTDEKGDCIKIPAWNAICTGLFSSNRALLDRLHDDTDAADAVCSALTYASSGESLRNALEISVSICRSRISILCSIFPTPRSFFRDIAVREFAPCRCSVMHSRIRRLRNCTMRRRRPVYMRPGRLWQRRGTGARTGCCVLTLNSIRHARTLWCFVRPHRCAA